VCNIQVKYKIKIKAKIVIEKKHTKKQKYLIPLLLRFFSHTQIHLQNIQSKSDKMNMQTK